MMEIDKNLMGNISGLAAAKGIPVKEAIERAIAIFLTINLLPPKEAAEIYSQLAKVEFEKIQKPIK